jgi:hypothetical protein
MCVHNCQHNYILNSSAYFKMLKNNANIFFLNIYLKFLIFHKEMTTSFTKINYMLILQKKYIINTKMTRKYTLFIKFIHLMLCNYYIISVMIMLYYVTILEMQFMIMIKWPFPQISVCLIFLFIIENVQKFGIFHQMLVFCP